MIEMPYEKGKLYCKGTEFILKAAKERESNNDDFFLFIFGQRSTGKSRLMLHLLEAYLKKEASIKYIGLRKGDFASALYQATHKKLPRCCVNDEGNLNSKNAMTKYNKDTIDTYYSIRGLCMFHIWCNPSLNIDKEFLEKIVNGVILTFTKFKTGARLYYYFTKKNLLKLYEKYKKLDEIILRKNAHQYGFFRGWYKDYDGFLLKEYEALKDNRMIEKVNDFHEEYGEEHKLLTQAQMVRALKVSLGFFKKHKKIIEEKKLIPDVVMAASGKELYPKEYIDLFRKEMLNGTS